MVKFLRNKLRFTFLMWAILWTSSVVEAIVLELAPEDLMSNYNLVALGSYTTTSHSEGKFIVFGDTYGDVSGAPNVQSVPSNEYSVVVGGNIKGGMTINSGSVLISTNGVNSNVTVQNKIASFTNGGTTKQITINGSGNFVFDANMDLSPAAAAIKNFSKSLGLLENDATASVSVDSIGNLLGAINDTNGDGVVVVNLSYTELAKISNNNTKSIETNLAGIDGLLINVTGRPVDGVQLKNDGWGDTFASKVLFNFVDVVAGDTLVFGGSKFWGSILAPEADLLANNVIEGTVVAHDISHGGQQIHLPAIDSNFVEKLTYVIPEPNAYVLILGLCALGLAGARREKDRD